MTKYLVDKKQSYIVNVILVIFMTSYLVDKMTMTYSEPFFKTDRVTIARCVFVMTKTHLAIVTFVTEGINKWVQKLANLKQNIP